MGSSSVEYSAAVVGAGPGGLAAAASLLDAGIEPILWIDRVFKGGRLNENYREISSNTKAGIYLDAMTSSKVCQEIVDAEGEPNPMTRLEEIDRESTCQLSLAGDVINMLTEGVLKRPGVEQCLGEVQEARFDEKNERWVIDTEGRQVVAERLILATGSHPHPQTFHETYNSKLQVLDLDRCMIKSTLPSLFDTRVSSTTKTSVAVIGNSHSGILVCRNLYELAEEDKVDMKILNFRRRSIKYAEYREDGIVNDNSGLKGATADWAKDVLEKNPNTETIEQVDLGEDEQETYNRYLPQCTHIVYATGYEPNPLPRLYLGDRRIDQELEFDMRTSGFKVRGSEKDKSERGLVKGLFGCGIAFPEKVKDPEGNVEAAVGVAKFFKFAERVKGDWLEVR